MVKKQLRLIDKTIQRLEKLYKAEYIRVLDEVKGLVLELYAEIGPNALLSHLYQFKRYYKLVKAIQNKLTQLGVKQEQIFTEEMEKFYKDNVKILDDQFDRPFSITDEEIKEIVKQHFIEETLWSDSIWKDKALLLSKVKHELVMSVAAGKTIDQMADSLKAETLTNNFYNAKRLVRTEVVNYYVHTTVEKYKEAGIKEVVYHACMDDRTCEECAGKNEKVYPINSKKLPPTHPNCRCYITPVI